MLRIMMPGAMKAPSTAAPSIPSTPSDPTQTPPDPDSDASQEPDDDADDVQMIGHKIPAQAAGYQGPEHGPFQCSNCKFFENPNSCAVVDGTIDPSGCCNNFTSASSPVQDESAEGTNSDTSESSSSQDVDNASSDEGSVGEGQS